MTTLVPSSPADIRAALSAALGKRLDAVRYRYLVVGDRAEYVAGDVPCVDTNLLAVDLQFADDARLVVTWAISGDVEGLHLSDEPDAGLIDAVPTVDASTRSGWNRLVGRTLTGVAGAWYPRDDVRALWSLRLDFGDEHVVIALGGGSPKGDGIVFESDEVIVIFDEAVSRRHRPTADGESAWGSPLDL
jgi:hypothetical protein